MQTVKLAAFARFAVVGLVAPFAFGQVARAQEAIPAPVETTAKPAPPKEEAVEKPDYALLLRALKGLKDAAAFGYTAQSTLQGAATGISLTAHQKLDLVALRDGRLHVNVALWLGEDEEKARKYTVVGDGAKLYTYRPDTMQYGVKGMDALKLQEETSRLGILGALYFNRDLSNLVDNTTPDGVEQMFEQLKTYGVKFSGGKVGETPVFTLNITPPAPPAPPKAADGAGKAEADVKPEPKPTLVLRFFVDADTAQFRQLELTGQQGGNRLTVIEKIVRQTNRPAYESPAFRFTPGAKDTKVADVPVDLFK